MIGSRQVGDYTLADGRKVEVEYCFYPEIEPSPRTVGQPMGTVGGAAEVEIVSVVELETGNVLLLAGAELERLEEMLLEDELDSEYELDWRSEWDD